jgi:Peptidase propeptide and YPEB domain
MHAVMRWSLLSVVVIGGSLCATSSQVVGAQQTVTTHLPDSLLKLARVGEHAARLTAEARVPHARVAAVELERENGHLQYSYDLKVPGQSGTTEVNVDALTGAVLGAHHEGALDEAKEVAAKPKQ